MGYSKEIHVDRGPQFDSDNWRHLLQSVGIKRHDSGVESHNALGVGEKYHDFLRRIFRKVRSEHPSIPAEDCLSLAVSAMSNTAGPNGLVPILLVFGVVPQLPFGFSDLPEQRERMKAMKEACDAMVTAVSSSRIRTALNRNVPASADSEIQIGSHVLFYREKPNSWEGPYLVVAGDNKKLWLSIKGELKEVSVDKIREYKPDPSKIQGQNVFKNGALSSEMTDKNTLEIDKIFDEVVSGENFLTQVQSRMYTLTTSTEGKKEVIETPNPVLITELLEQNDHRTKSPRFMEAKFNEVAGLRDRGTWNVVKISSLPKDANIIGG